MKNWLGQRIKVDDVVWRGAREGDTSSFKIGRVIEATDSKIKVEWLFYSSLLYFADRGVHVKMPRSTGSRSVGTFRSAESLIAVHPALLLYAKLWSDRADEYISTKSPAIAQAIIAEFGEE